MSKRPTVYTIADACEATGLARNTLMERAARAGVGFTSVGGTQLFEPRDLPKILAAVGKRGRPRKA